jgi:dolichyl-phosphate beta-glucosyltransferase
MTPGASGPAGGVTRRLRRLATGTAVAPAVDGALLVGLARGAGLPVALADGLAIAGASATSYVVHRAGTFGDDPHVRWVHQPGAFVAAAVVSGAVDVAVVRSRHPRSASELVRAKGLGLVAAGALRLTAYRYVLWTRTRSALGARIARPSPPGELRLTVVVPAYGEAGRVGAAVAQLRTAVAPLGEDVEVLVVDDGSPDGTAEEAAAAGARVLRLPENRGKGAAVRAGVLAARGRSVVFTDADLAYPPEQVAAVVAALEDGWDVVVGSRRHPESADTAGASALRVVSGRLFNLLTAAVLLGQYRDTQCGLKGFRSDVGRLLFTRTKLDGFAFDVEVLHLVERYRLSLTEVPVVLVRAPGSTVRVGLDALRMLRDLFRVRRWAGLGVYDLAPGDAVPVTAPAHR